MTDIDEYLNGTAAASKEIFGKRKQAFYKNEKNESAIQIWIDSRGITYIMHAKAISPQKEEEPQTLS